MNLSFEKYHGAGNDFILLDNRDNRFPFNEELIRAMCHRRLGIGADGLMLLETTTNADFGMRYFNSDGPEGSMCGNGGRCITAFAHQLGIIGSSARFTAIDGLHESMILSGPGEPYRISLGMKDVEEIRTAEGYYFTDTGSPHHVVFVKNLNDYDVVGEGRKIRNSAIYGKKGTNVNFAELIDGVLHVRTYERGVEDETLSCGTGVTSTALIYAFLHNINTRIDLIAPGGKLSVSFRRQGDHFTEVRLEGPVVHVFSGTFDTQTLI